jgi:hypothetical protein
MLVHCSISNEAILRVAIIRSKPNQRFLKNATGLHIIAYSCLARMAQLLLEHEDVDADSTDKGGQTPLSAWAEVPSPQCCQYG